MPEETQLGRTLEYHHNHTSPGSLALLHPMPTRSDSTANQNSHQNLWLTCPLSQHAIDSTWYGLRNNTANYLIRPIIVLTMDI